MPDTPAKIVAPWTPEQVDALNAYQASGRFHPYTCPHGCGMMLTAKAEGWFCGNIACPQYEAPELSEEEASDLYDSQPVVQTWAHASSLTIAERPSILETMAALKEIAAPHYDEIEDPVAYFRGEETSDA